MKEQIAVIGSTGFVGSNLMTQVGSADGFNSKNIESIEGKSYDLLFCAGARAEKWKINQAPESDRANNQRLMNNMAKVSAKKLILLSTVDVYPNPIGVNEDSAIDFRNLHPYGLHHLELEKFCNDHFDTLIVRLPGLFGDGLKKNVIYDFLHDNNVDQIHADGVFQFYYLDNLWHDIQIALTNHLKLVNFATEPVSVAEVAKAGFDREFQNRPEGKTAARYDFRTKHAAIFGGKDGYMEDKNMVLAEMRKFVVREQGKS